MTRELRTDIGKLLHDVPSWNNTDNAEAKARFRWAMRGREYGYEPCLDAWNWFLTGWSEANEPQGEKL